MNHCEAMVRLKAAREGIYGREFCVHRPRLVEECTMALRALGMTMEQIHSEFPRDVVERGIELIRTNPGEFSRQCQEAAEWHRNRN